MFDECLGDVRMFAWDFLGIEAIDLRHLFRLVGGQQNRNVVARADQFFGQVRLRASAAGLACVDPDQLARRTIGDRC